MNRIMVCLAMLTIGWVTPRMATADCCEHCGCQCQCGKVCRLVPGTQKVTKVTYDCECEDICIPGKSCLLGYKCESNDDCECGQRKHPEPVWQPTCGCVKTRHKLVKIETTKEVPVCKCVVVNLCPNCCAQAAVVEKAAVLAATKQAPDGWVATTSTVPAADAQSKLAAHQAEPTDQSEAEDVQLVSHESKSPTLVDRLKRSFQPILGR